MLAPLALLCACTAGTPELPIESNWYTQTGERHVIDPTEETCSYSVTFAESDEAKESGYYFSYENGTYETRLASERIALSDGTTAVGYKFTTSLFANVTVHYAGAASEPVQNTLKTEVLFLDADSGLKPIKSRQEVHELVPLGTPSAKFDSLEESYRSYDYTLTTEYSLDLSEATMKFDDLTTEEDDAREPETVKLKGSGSYLDNEQLVFALRGLDLSTGATFRSINPNSKQCVSVRFSETPVSVTETCTFEMNGETKEQEKIAAYEFSLGYSQQYTGQSKKFVYAKKVSATNNTYHNALLRVEQPAIYSHGTFTFKITSANFTN